MPTLLNNNPTKGRTLIGVVVKVKDDSGTEKEKKKHKNKVQVRIPEFHGPKNQSDLPKKLAEKDAYWTKDEDLPWIPVVLPLGYEPEEDDDLSKILSIDEMVYVMFTDDAYQTPVIIGTTSTPIHGSSLTRLVESTGGLLGYDASGGGTMSIPVTPGEFGDPISTGQWVLSSPYGDRICPFHGAEFHSGIDMATSTGTPILASLDGRVVFAGWQGGYGNYTTIQHSKNGKTFYSSYAHQSRIYVSRGQTVTKQTIIGAVGNTGNSTGPHLHFEIKTGTGSGYENPMDYIKKGQH